MLRYGRKKLTRSDYGPFRLGKVAGTVINIVAVIWLVLAIVFSTFPSFEPVISQNMNYSTVVLAGWIVFGVAYYFLFGRRVYTGPVVETEAAELSVVGSRHESK